MKILAATAAAVFAAVLAPAALAASSTERTSMPEKCAERDVNCVVQDGVPPRRAVAPKPDEKSEKKEKRGNTPPGTDRSGGGPASGAIIDPAGVTRK